MEVKFAKTEHELERIIGLRYKILRQPWQQPIDTASDELEEKAVNAYINDIDGDIVACGRLQENEHKVGQIRYMAVASGQQGKGYGKHILNALEEKAKEMGLISIELQARENAKAFYERHGYHEKEKSFLLWGQIQHYLMEKILTK